MSEHASQARRGTHFSQPDDAAQTQPGLLPPDDGHTVRSRRRPGEVVAGKYVLVRYLARGGMAEVWLGTHVSLKTDVAVKFVDVKLTGEGSRAASALERFRSEAQISAQLGSRTRHVVAVHDAGTHDDIPYLVMEYVPGHTLEDEVEKGGPLEPARFADVLDQVADALDAAHALGIVHRDIKPSNLMLIDEADGRLTVKLADFGIAKAFGTSLTVDRPRETQEGELVGSPAFMSPEQARGVASLDSRTDVWSVGVVAYETLTGQACFEGISLLDVFAAISMSRHRPASTVRPDLPRGVDAWVRRALAPDPDDRYQSVGEMAVAFRALLAAGPRRSRRLVVGAVAVAALGLAVVVLVLTAVTRPRQAVTSGASASASAASVASSLAAAPPSQTAAPASTPSARPSALDVADLPPADGRHSPSAGRSASRPVPPPPPPVTAAPHPAPEATPPRPPKRIDPSEIQ
jgi:hypothetical protein